MQEIFDSDNDELADEYFEKLEDYMWNRFWHHESAGAIVADLNFRRIGNNVEISWNNEDLEEGIEFVSLKGSLLIPYNEYIQEVDKLIESYRKMWN